jgi:hypothetical protein
LVACAGNALTFTASPTNGGSAPQYQWLANGAPAGNGPTFSSSTLSNGDQISCVLTSNAACANPLQANSNALQVSILPPVTPSVSISATSNSICSGQSVTLNANVVNGGTATQYLWTQNGIAVGTNSPSTRSKRGAVVSGRPVRCRLRMLNDGYGAARHAPRGARRRRVSRPYECIGTRSPYECIGRPAGAKVCRGKLSVGLLWPPPPGWW